MSTKEDLTRIINDLNIINDLIEIIRLKMEAGIIESPSLYWLNCTLWQRKRALEKIQMELTKPWSYNPSNTLELVYDEKGNLIEVNQVDNLSCEYT